MAAGLLSSQTAQAAELVQNGSFTLGMTGWKTAPAHGDWNPYPAGAVALYLPTYGYPGPILYQNLNVANVGGQTLALSASLQAVYPSSGKTVAVYLDYATASSQIKRILALNPDNSQFSSGYATASTNVTLPAEATKLVRLVVGTLDGSQFTANRLA